MANSKRKCAYCGVRKNADDMFIVGIQAFCDKDHYIENQVENKDKLIKKGREIQAKQERAENRNRKKSVRKLNDWKVDLRKLVQQWVRTVRDKGHNCCTCGNPLATEGGHYISVGSNPDLQFEPTNIHPQCHECNCYNSGRRAEYDKYIMSRYGQEHFDWLNGPHPSLKEIYPHWTDYEKEIKRYRLLLREAGVKPCR